MGATRILLFMVLLLPAVLQAGQLEAWSDDDCWAFKPGDDPFTDDTLFDLRALQDKVAGERGRIRYDANGDFVRGDGSPIRFWAVNIDTLKAAEENVGMLEAHARHLSKRGVNMVRGHTYTLHNAGDESPRTQPSDAAIDRVQRMVSTLKRHGIHTTMNIYHANDGKLFW
ncbi:MAG: hypothetical protein FWF96_03280, partial [Kiritimatiellaeota bacterium]|nr:hypothetical protein [Kiritimatiellota bacterium]